MKILFLVRRFWPEIGGVEKHSLEVGKRLVKRGHKITVVTESIKNQELSIKGKEVIDGIKIFRIPVTVGEKCKKIQIWLWLLKHRELIEKADIVHCHDVFFWFLPFRFLYPTRKVFTTWHGWEGIYPPKLKAKIIRKISEKLSTGNICVGDYLRKWYRTKPDQVTYGGVELMQNAKIKNQNDNTKFKKIVYVGRLEEDTGLPIYLEALKMLKEKGVEFEVRFLGEGEWRNEAKKFGEVVGLVEDVKKYVKEARYVFTSGYLSILEAMRGRRLVFAVYDNPLKKDYLLLSPFASILAVAGGAEDLAKEVWYYFNQPEEEKKIVSAAWQWAKDQTWEKVTEIYLRLWQKK